MREKVHCLSLILTILSLAMVASHTGGVLEFKDILPDDPSTYDKMRPPKKEGKPTVVYFHVTVMSLDSINENSMTYAADIFFAQSWKDHRLRLPENMTSEYRLLEVDWLRQMWRPDSFFKNAKQVTFQTMTIPNHYVWLYQSKSILYMVKLTLTLSCAMNYVTYPHDTQECKLQMESLSHTTEDLIFEWDPKVPLVVDDNIELPQFDLVNNRTADCSQVYSTGHFTCLEVAFLLKRRLGYYLFHTYMPTCLIVIMSWISFWIKPEAAPARVTLGVTSLLTLSTQHAKSQASLPPVSYIKIIDMFMSTCTIFVFLALMEYALVNFVLGDGPEGTPIIKKSPKDSPTYSKKKKKFLPSILNDVKRRCSGRSSRRTQVLDIPLSSTTFQTETSNDQINTKLSSPRPSSTGVEIASHNPQRSPVFSLHHETPLQPHCHHSSYSHPHDIYPTARQTVLTSSPSCRHIDCQLSTHPTPVVHHCSETHFCDYHGQIHPDSLCERHSFAIDHLPGSLSYCPHTVHSHSCLSNYHCSPQYSEKRGSFPRCSSICSAHEGSSSLLSHDPVIIRGSSPCLARHPSSKEKRGKRGECSLERRSRSVERPSERTVEPDFRDHRLERCVSGESGEHLVEFNRKRSTSVRRVVVKDKDIQTEDWNEGTSIKPTQSPRGASRRREPSNSDSSNLPPDDSATSALLSVPPPPPPPNKTPTANTPAQKRRARAIMVDRFSRVFFPSTFGLINAFYWIMFWIYL